jgi:hypothetical protein
MRCDTLQARFRQSMEAFPKLLVYPRNHGKPQSCERPADREMRAGARNIASGANPLLRVEIKNRLNSHQCMVV